MNYIEINRAKSIFLAQCEKLLDIIHSDNFLLGGECNLDGVSIISSTNNIDELYFDEKYYELLCDVPYEVEEYGESDIDDNTHKLIRNLDLQYGDKLYYAITKISQNNIFSHIKETRIRERFLDAVCEDFARFFEYFTILAYGYGKAELKSNFLELQLEVYKNGGFPCGWDGSYPNGKMLVFIPKNKL